MLRVDNDVGAVAQVQMRVPPLLPCGTGAVWCRASGTGCRGSDAGRVVVGVAVLMLVVLVHHRCTWSVTAGLERVTVQVAAESQCVRQAQKQRLTLSTVTRHRRPPIQPAKRDVYTHYPHRDPSSSAFVTQGQ